MNRKVNSLRFIIFILFFLIVICLCFCGANKNSEETPIEEYKKISYVSSSDVFPNPERGFYKHYQIENGTLNLSILNSFRKDNITLILRVFYLKEFRNSPISPEMLEKIRADLTTVRKAGLKAIIRFAYSDNELEPDAPLSMIKMHLDQLAPILSDYKDIILVMQAGFIGAWGEWYYTSNNLNTPSARKAVLDKILEVLPIERCVQVRTPKYKQEYIGRTVPIAPSEAYTSLPVARIGHHNDCFLASVDDYGTYIDVVADKEYLSKEGLYVPIGGETCPPSGIDPADCEKAQSEMRYLRWSFLNQDYYRGVNDNWIVQGCMDNIIKNLGYRFVLVSGNYSIKHTPGSGIKVDISLVNQGYAPLFNKRNVEIILESVNGKNTYVAKLPDDPRTWKPNHPVQIKHEIVLPLDIPDGNYKLYINLPDSELLLHDRPEYSIRFANKDVWVQSSGYNDLGIIINVEMDLDLPKSSSDIVFTHD